MKGIFALLCLSAYFISTDGCGKTVFTSSPGVIKSPNYPRLYPHKSDCSYHLRAPAGHVITVNLIELNLAPKKVKGKWGDYLQMKDAEVDTNTVTYGGSVKDLTEEDKSFTSETNNVVVRFVSDKKKTKRKGFKVTFQFADASRQCDVTSLPARVDVTGCREDDAGAMTCSFRCASSVYRLSPSDGRVRCQDNRFPGLSCDLKPQLLNECEEKAFKNCSYSLAEVAEHYKTATISEVDSNLGTIDDELALVPDPVISLARSTTVRCPGKYCQKRFHPRLGRKIYPFRCGVIPRPPRRLTCLYCRICDCDRVKVSKIFSS